MEDRTIKWIIDLALLITIIMWIIQAQKDRRRRRKTSRSYKHTADTDGHESQTSRPDPSEQKKVIERQSPKNTQPRSSTDELFSDSFSALTGALSGSFDDSENQSTSVPLDRHQAAPAPSYSQRSSSPTPDPGVDVPESLGIDNYEPLPSEVAAPRFDAASLPTPNTSSAHLVQGAHPSAPPKTSATPRKPSTTAGTKSPSSLGTARPVRERRFDDMHRGSAAISRTHESSTMCVHDVSEDHGSCLSTSSLFSQN